MGNKIFVGNLPFRVEGKTFLGKELREAFAQFGEITDSVVITDKFSGRSKGFGFVTFAEDASAAKAIAEMDGKEVEGRALKVSEAKPM